ncbi:casein kinase II regulatory subunit-domain-containing protein [Rhodotorula diobovata]|uniref:Casein kinase II subunit beta n=1 Tax=Rhodotorula diobovata TaxID=5288 RepID=A0A5C5FPA8_9BASI|nr:casein kinase II regulatory subunit-domain-containing protein [Rhodotorula diobovata]
MALPSTTALDPATPSASASAPDPDNHHLDNTPVDMQDDDDDQHLEQDDDQQELYESSSSPSTETDTLTWINWFCSLPGHEYFCEVAEEFIEDDFNLTGLASLVPFYKEAMEMVLDVEPAEDDEIHRVPDVSIVESSAELLYGLIHQRYILTRQGQQQMYAKFDAGHFGTCPRVYCTQSKLVPCGRSDLPGVDTVKLFCPSCLDMYVPPSSRFQGVDGAFFGTTFPHLLFQTYPPPTTLPAPAPASADPATREATTPLTSLSKVYVPRIYGFKVSERARSGPRMQWMRMRPRTEGEIDWDENAVAVDPAAAAGSGGGAGAGGKGALFDDDNVDEEDEVESEEEEEGAAGAGAGAGAGAAGAGAEPGADKMVTAVASALGASKLASPPASSAPVACPAPGAAASLSSAPPTPAPAPAAAAAAPAPRVLPLRTDRAIKPLPRSPTARAAAASASASASSASPKPASSASAASSAASAALAATIQRHLAASGPAPPAPARVAAERERREERGRAGAPVGRQAAVV